MPKDQQIDYTFKEENELVKSVAYSIAHALPVCIDVRDLIDEGWLGLLDAKSRYDPKINDNFKAYASIRIKGAILDYLRGEDILSRTERKIQRGSHPLMVFQSFRSLHMCFLQTFLVCLHLEQWIFT